MLVHAFLAPHAVRPDEEDPEVDRATVLVPFPCSCPFDLTYHIITEIAKVLHHLSGLLKPTM